jgi:hypothetical protein
LLASGGTLTQQRVIRRLLTNPGDYLWGLTYGAGLGQMVGQPVNTDAIEAIVRSQIFQESSVAAVPAPQVTTVLLAPNEPQVTVSYADATTGAASVLTLPVS